MAMRITPSYDFTVNEVPTHAKLRQMLNDPSLTGIPTSQLDSGLAFIQVTDSSGLSLTEGQFWTDNLGSLWVESKWGRVRVWRPMGGMETRRYMTTYVGTNPPANALPLNPWIGRYELNNVPGTGQNEATEVFWIFDRTPASGIIFSGVNSDTADSGTQARVVIRGGCPYHVNGTQHDEAVDRILGDNTSSDQADCTNLPPPVDANERGPSMGMALNKSPNNNISWCWMHGIEVASH